MKSYIPLFIAMVFFYSAACSGSRRAHISYVTISNCGLYIPPAWVRDTNGCNGDRRELSHLVDSIGLKGYSLACIYFALGKPNDINDDSTAISYTLVDSCDTSFWGDRAWLSILFENSICTNATIFWE